MHVVPQETEPDRRRPVRALVLFYADDSYPETPYPIGIIPQAAVENLDHDDVAQIWREARGTYGALSGECRTAWVDMPEVSALFGTPELGTATLLGGDR